MDINPHERVALFIDGSNLYAAAKMLGFDIDYKRLLDLFNGQGRLVRAFYYTALLEDQEYSPIRPLVDWLDYNGYTMVTKPAKEFTDAMGRRKIKGNMDIELAVDMIEIYGPERLMVNSAGDWGPSKPTAVPDFILAMRRRGHPESLIRRVVYENPLQFFSQSRNFQFTPPEVPQTAEL